jgi:hypothetical protein
VQGPLEPWCRGHLGSLNPGWAGVGCVGLSVLVCQKLCAGLNPCRGAWPQQQQQENWWLAADS